MVWWLQTRGLSFDYRFFGQGPAPERWWSAYLSYSAPEDPMLVVETDPEGWRFYATAMPTDRTDGASPPRAIRCSLLAVGDRDQADQLLHLIGGYHSGALGLLLNQQVGADQVETWAATRRIDPATQRALDPAIRALDPASASDPGTEVPTTGSWQGADACAQARSGLAASAVQAARSGTRGVFATLNLLSELAEITHLPVMRQTTIQVFLIVDDTPDPGAAAPEVGLRPAPGGAASPPNPPLAGPSQLKRTGGPQLPKLPPGLWAGLLLGILVLLAALVALG